MIYKHLSKDTSYLISIDLLAFEIPTDIKTHQMRYHLKVTFMDYQIEIDTNVTF